MSAEQLKVAGIGVKRTATVSEVARGAPPRLNLTVEVENPANVSIYVWASVRAFDYDPATHVLSVHLEERTRELPKGIKVISEHPRTPTQVEGSAQESRHDQRCAAGERPATDSRERAEQVIRRRPGRADRSSGYQRSIRDGADRLPARRESEPFSPAPSCPRRRRAGQDYTNRRDEGQVAMASINDVNNSVNKVNTTLHKEIDATDDVKTSVDAVKTSVDNLDVDVKAGFAATVADSRIWKQLTSPRSKSSFI